MAKFKDSKCYYTSSYRGPRWRYKRGGLIYYLRRRYTKCQGWHLRNTVSSGTQLVFGNYLNQRWCGLCCLILWSRTIWFSSVYFNSAQQPFTISLQVPALGAVENGTTQSDVVGDGGDGQHVISTNKYNVYKTGNISFTRELPKSILK